MAKCDCYFQHGTRFLCYGTKETEECTCGGDTSRCDFYPEKRVPKGKMYLRPCPFCKGKMEDKWPNVTQIGENRWNVCHYCPHPNEELGVSINVYGSTKKEAVDRWNNQQGVPNGK